jgi:hypothetical protein
MKFFRNRYKTKVSTRPDTIVPVIESSGFFMGLLSSDEIHVRRNAAKISATLRVA